MKKRLVSLLLVLCMVMGFLPAMIPEAKAAVSTEAEFVSKLSELQSIYVHGEYWNWYNVYNGQVGLDDIGTTNTRWNPSIWGNEWGTWGSPAGTGTEAGTCVTWCGSGNPTSCNCVCGSFRENQQCAGYALKMFWLVWGTSSYYKYYDIENVCAGDIVRYGTHSIFVTGVSGDTVYYTDCNRGKGDLTGPCRVLWNSATTKSEIKKDGLVYIGRCSANPGWDGVVDAAVPEDIPFGEYEVDFAENTHYAFQNVSSGKRINVPASLKWTWDDNAYHDNHHGGFAVAYTADGTVDQLFTVAERKTELYSIHPEALSAGHLLQVYSNEGAVSSGMRIETFPSSSLYGSWQLFYIVPVSETEFAIVPSSNKSLCMSFNSAAEAATNFSWVYVNTYTGEAFQKWHIYDADGNQVKATKKCQHSGLNSISAKSATCTTNGNYAYWYCSDCGKYFSDSTATTETTKSAMTIAALGHNYYDYVCTQCGEWESYIVDMGYCGAEGDGTNLQWVLFETGELEVRGSGSMADYEYQKSPFWEYREDITSLFLFGSSIGKYAFADCLPNEIEMLVFSPSIKKIGDFAFYNNPEFGFSLENTEVEYIGAGAFRGCKNFPSELFIPDCVTEIGAIAFEYCDSIEHVYIGEGVSSIGSRVFENCTVLEAIEVDENNSTYADVDGVLFSKKLTSLICYPAGKRDSAYIIPDAVTTIAACSFYNCDNLTVVHIPDLLETIDTNTFAHCDNLRTVYGGKGLKTIGECAFTGCYSLESVLLPSVLSTVGETAFYDCTALSDVLYYGTEAMWKSVSVGDYNDPLMEAEIHFIGTVYTCNKNNTHTISDTCSDCGLSISEQTGNCIDENKDCSCDFCGGTMGHSLTATAAKAATCTASGNKAYWYCSGCKKYFSDSAATTETTLSAMTIAKLGHRLTATAAKAATCTASGNKAYWYCSGCKKYFSDSAATTETTLSAMTVSALEHNYVNNTCTRCGVFAPGITAAGYCGGEGDGTNLTWKIENGNLIISGTGAMANFSASSAPWYSCCSSISAVTIGDSVTTIGDFAFRDCKMLTSVRLPDALVSFNNSAFVGCDALNRITVSEGNEYFYSVDGVVFSKDMKTLVAFPTGFSGAYNIPECVTTVWYRAFYCCENLTNITIPTSVTKIDISAFSHCSSLLAAKIPDSVTSVGNSAFTNCTAMMEVVIGSGVTAIDDYTFASCSALVTVEIGENVTSVGADAFWRCDSLERIKIPNGVTSMSSGAFYGTSISNVYYCGTQEQWAEIKLDGINIGLENAQIHYMETAYDCNGDNTHTISDTCSDCGWSIFEETGNCIDEDKDCSCDLCQGTMGHSLTAIAAKAATCTASGNKAYWYCSGCKKYFSDSAATTETTLSAMTIAKLSHSLTATPAKAATCTASGNKAYWYCSGCKKYFSDSAATTETTLSAMTIAKLGHSLTSTPAKAATCTASGNKAYWYCSGCKKYFSDSAATAETTKSAMTVSALEHNYVNNVCSGCGGFAPGITAAGYCGNSSDGKNLQWKIESNTLTVSGIGGMADYNETNKPWEHYVSNIETVVIEDGVATIGAYAFYACDGLTSVILPHSVTEIGTYAFGNCTALLSVYIPNLSAWCMVNFGDGDANPLRYANELYVNGELVIDLVIPDGVTTVGDFAFFGYDGLTSLTIGNTVTDIGKYAFYGCDGLTSLIVPDSVRVIGANAFAYNHNLTSVSLGSSVESINEHAFDACNAMNEVHISDLEAWLKIRFNDGRSNPSYYAKKLYVDGELLTELVVPNGVSTIGNYAFIGDSELTTVTIPEGVTSIGYKAFTYCAGLTTMTIPESVISIGSDAFLDCAALTDVYYYGAEEQWVAINASVLPADTELHFLEKVYACNGDKTHTVSVVCSICKKSTAAETENCIDMDDNNLCDLCRGAVCVHASTSVSYKGAGNGTHTVTETCDDCGKKVLTEAEVCFDYNKDDKCDLCRTIMPECEHTNVNTTYIANGDSTHTITKTCVDCEETVGEDETEDCIDDDKNGRCDLCGGEYICKHENTQLEYEVKEGSGIHTVNTVCSECGESVSATDMSCSDADGDYLCDLCGANVCDHGETSISIKKNNDGTHKVTETCDVCGETVSTENEKCYDVNGDDKCDLCRAAMPEEEEPEIETFSIAGANMTLGNELEMNVMFPKTAIDDAGTELTAYVTHYSEDGDVVHTFTEFDAYGSSYYKLSFRVAAAQMTDTIAVEFKDADGNVYNNEYTNSVRNYVMNNIGRFNTTIQTLMVDMLNYGTAAQDQFTYHQDAYANALLSDAQKALATGDVEVSDLRVKGTNYAGSTLSLEDRILLNIVFNGKFTADELAAMSATVSFDNALDGVTQTHENAAITAYGSSRFQVTVDQIVLADASQPVTVTVYNADGTEYGSAVDSVSSYIYRMDDGTNPMYSSIMRFAASALAYGQSK